MLYHPKSPRQPVRFKVTLHSEIASQELATDEMTTTSGAHETLGNVGVGSEGNRRWTPQGIKQIIRPDAVRKRNLQKTSPTVPIKIAIVVVLLLRRGAGERSLKLRMTLFELE